MNIRPERVKAVTETLVRQMPKDEQGRPKGLPERGSNSDRPADAMYDTYAGLADPGYPGWITGTGRGPVIGQSKQAMQVAPDAHPMYSSLTYQGGGMLADQAAYGKPRLKALGNWGSDFGNNHMMAAGKGALLGALLGAGIGQWRNKQPGVGAAIGAGAGGLAAGGLSYLAKRSSSGIDHITQLIEVDFSLPQQAKSMLVRALSGLNTNQANSLSDLIRSSLGASVGLVVARYLLGLGLIGTAALSALGGAIVYGLGQQGRNAMGERMHPELDNLGRRW